MAHTAYIVDAQGGRHRIDAQSLLVELPNGTAVELVLDGQEPGPPGLPLLALPRADGSRGMSDPRVALFNIRPGACNALNLSVEMLDAQRPPPEEPGLADTADAQNEAGENTAPLPLQPVDLAHAYRLLNHGPTVLVGSAHGGRINVMAAAWAMPLDFHPPKVAVVIDKATLTRELVDASGVFSLNVPTVAQAELTRAVGGMSGKDQPDKLDRCAVQTLPAPGTGVPLVQGCVAHLECRVLPATAHVAVPHDLFLAEVTAAWADARVFSDGRWHFERAPGNLRSLHHVAGGHFYATGDPVPPASR